MIHFSLGDITGPGASSKFGKEPLLPHATWPARALRSHGGTYAYVSSDPMIPFMVQFHSFPHTRMDGGRFHLPRALQLHLAVFSSTILTHLNGSPSFIL
ncbi:hypothetical protein AVEN_188157-1 [Araneus ventricosus]|uniref:Uncharacterized protein n=1 Tax=Araneus ventricosus TaxID=182803 RepID=A0A4Y2XDI7_ARAVE|nr:hypothetical protein AVEN_188157-1 [Araneus ventricosus]